MNFILIGGSGANHSTDNSYLYIKSSFGPYVSELFDLGLINSCYFFHTNRVDTLCYRLPSSNSFCISTRFQFFKLCWLVIFNKSNFLLFLPNASFIGLILSVQKTIFRSHRKICLYVGGEFYKSRKSFFSSIKYFIYRYIFLSADYVIARGKSIHADIPTNILSIETLPISRPLSAHDIQNKLSKISILPKLNSFRIGFMGRNSPGKGIDILCQAFNFVVSKEPDLFPSLHLAGFAIQEFDISNFCTHSSIVFNPYLYGWIDNDDQFSEFFNSIDILVMPSRSSQGEGVPRVIHESLLRGVPVIASNISGVLSNHLDDVLLFTESSVSSLCDQLISLSKISTRLHLQQMLISYNNSIDLISPARQHFDFLIHNHV